MTSRAGNSGRLGRLKSLAAAGRLSTTNGKIVQKGVVRAQSCASLCENEPAAAVRHARYALELAERGYVALAPDYPLLGDYQGDIEQLGYAGGTAKAIWDNMRAVDLLQAMAEVDSGRIGVVGLSLGGHNALFTAAFDPRLKVIVSSCGFD